MIRNSLSRLLVTLLVLTAGVAGVRNASAVTASAPIPVRDVDRGEAQPVNGSCTTFDGPFSGLAKCALYTVPTGKRLVVESVSFLAITDSANSMTSVKFGVDGPNDGNIVWKNGVYSMWIASPGIGAGIKTYANTQSMRFYMEAGQELAFEFDYTGGTNYGKNASFSGYLVDK